MKIEKGSAEFIFFSDLFKFREKYHEPSSDREVLFNMADEAIKLSDKYDNTPFADMASSMINDVVCDMERRSKLLVS